MSGADEKMREVLERVAAEVRIPAYFEDIYPVLEERLLPLLLAGQDCRDCLEPGIPLDDKYMAAWDAALSSLVSAEPPQGEAEKEGRT